MKQLSFTLILCLLSIFSYSQTITSPPIFKGTQSLSVQFAEANQNRPEGDFVIFLYQNPDYRTITDILSFQISSLDNAILLMNKVLEIYSMPKTGKEQDITDNFEGKRIARYGFNQKVVYVEKKWFSKKEAEKLRTALISHK